MGAPWTLSDGGEDTYTFVRNPSVDATPTYAKAISSKPTLAPDGKPVIFQGQRETGTFTFSGLILEEAEYTALAAWFERPGVVRITDDLGRTFDVVIASFTPKRLPSGDWHHSYTVSALIVAMGGAGTP